MNKKQLWLNLKDYHFEELVPPALWDNIKERFGGENASTKAFAGKIARKLGWSEKFSLKAVTEYKKFVYLGVISDFAVTPSRVIDKVWHEHLLFSKAYREFCTGVIQYNFDHNPELIPMDEQTAAFNEQYHSTLELYKREFGIEPPTAIWGIPKFDIGSVTTTRDLKKKKENTASADDTPLFMYFGSTGGDNSEHFSEFNGFEGGSGGGGGTEGSWDAGGDAGSDSGSSGCSSGCGGGGD